MSSPRSSTALERGSFLALLGVALVCELVVLVRMHLAEIVAHVPDDSFFYLIIAERLRDFGRFSFDGEHDTYGFQPLYQLVIAGLSFVIRDPVALLYVALALGSVLHVACAWLLFRLVRRSFGRSGAWTAGLFWLANPALVGWFWSVKENGLYALLILWMLLELQRAMSGEEGRRGALRFGLALGLAALARVNFVPLAAVVAAFVLLGWGWGRPLRERLRLLASSAGWASLVAGPWYLFAWLHFGSAFPTSGEVKFAGSKEYVARQLGVEWLSSGHFVHAARLALDYLDATFRAGASACGPLVQGAVIAVLVGWILARVRRVELPAFGAALVGCAAALALANAFLNALLLPQFVDYGQWYTAPEFVALGLAVGWIGALARRTLASPAGALLLALGLALGIAHWTQVRRVPWEWRGPRLDVLEGTPANRTIMLELGLWVRDHVPEGMRIGIRDPGIITYFSRRRLIPLDPLVNSRAFFLEESRDLLGYVRRERLSYVLDAGVRRGERLHARLLPEGSYEVVWVPYPEVDLHWASDGPTHWMLVRPLDTPGEAFLGPEDFAFGAYAPDSGAPDPRTPERERRIVRALEGFQVDEDVLRVRLAPHSTAHARLWLDEELARDSAAGPDGWIHWDVSHQRGRRARIEVTEPGAVVDFHPVDLR